MYISGSYYISPSGCVHYVTCIGNRYMLQNLYRTHIISLMIIWLHVMYISEHILYQPIWLCALCSLYWEQVHSAKLISIHVISLQIIWLHVLYISGHILISAHLAVCIMWPVLGTGTFCKNLYRHNNICEYMIACNVHIATYIFISFRLSVCIM